MIAWTYYDQPTDPDTLTLDKSTVLTINVICPTLTLLDPLNIAIAYTHEIEDTADTTDYVVAAGTGIPSDATCDIVLELWDTDTDSLYDGTWVSMDTTTAEITVDRNTYGDMTFKVRITYDDAY